MDSMAYRVGVDAYLYACRTKGTRYWVYRARARAGRYDSLFLEHGFGSWGNYGLPGLDWL